MMFGRGGAAARALFAKEDRNAQRTVSATTPASFKFLLIMGGLERVDFPAMQSAERNEKQGWIV